MNERNIEGLMAIKELMDFVKPGWQSQESYFRCVAHLKSLHRNEQYKYGDQSGYEVWLKHEANSGSISVPVFADHGFHSEFITRSQDMAFDGATGELTICGTTNQNEPYRIVLVFLSGDSSV